MALVLPTILITHPQHTRTILDFLTHYYKRLLFAICGIMDELTLDALNTLKEERAGVYNSPSEQKMWRPFSAKAYFMSGLFVVGMSLAVCFTSCIALLVMAVLAVGWTVLIVVGQWSLVPLGKPLWDWLEEVTGLGERRGG